MGMSKPRTGGKKFVEGEVNVTDGYVTLPAIPFTPSKIVCSQDPKSVFNSKYQVLILYDKDQIINKDDYGSVYTSDYVTIRTDGLVNLYRKLEKPNVFRFNTGSNQNAKWKWVAYE